jgi:hypothetical protein
VSGLSFEKRPRELVQSKLLYSCNADGVMSILKRACGNSSKLNGCLMDELMKFPNLKSETDPNLDKFNTDLGSYISTVKTLRKYRDLECDYTLNKLVSKFSYHHQLQWMSRYRKIDGLNLVDFSDFLAEKVAELPIAWLNTAEADMKSIEKKPRRVNAHNQVNKGKAPPSNCCVRCNEGHHLSKCPAYQKLSADEKLKFVFVNKICISFLASKEHRVKDCALNALVRSITVRDHITAPFITPRVNRDSQQFRLMLPREPILSDLKHRVSTREPDQQFHK